MICFKRAFGVSRKLLMTAPVMLLSLKSRIVKTPVFFQIGRQPLPGAFQEMVNTILRDAGGIWIGTGHRKFACQSDAFAWHANVLEGSRSAQSTYQFEQAARSVFCAEGTCNSLDRDRRRPGVVCERIGKERSMCLRMRKIECPAQGVAELVMESH